MARSALSRDSLHSLAFRVLAAVISLIASVVASRLLGASGKGAVGILAASAGMLASLLGLGLGSALTVAVANRGVSVRQAVMTSGAYAVVLSTLSALALNAGIMQLVLDQSASAILPLATGVAVGGLALADAVAGILQGSGRVRSGMVLRQATGVFQTLAVIVLASVGVRAIEWFAVAFAAAAWTVALFGSIHALASAGAQPSRSEPWSIRRVLLFGIQTQAIWVLLMLNYRVDMLLLGGLSSIADVGVYSVAVSFSEAAWFGVNSIVAVLLPHVTRSPMESSINRTLRGARVSVMYTVVACVAIYIVLRAWGVAVFGPEFAGSAPAFLALTPGLVMFCWYKILATHSIAVGRLGVPTALAAAGLAANVALNLILIPSLGAVGAGISSSISYSLTALVMILAFMKSANRSMREVLVPTADDIRSVWGGGRG